MNIASTSLSVRGGSFPRKDLPGAAREGRIQSSHRFPGSYPGTIRKLKYRQNHKKKTHLLQERQLNTNSERTLSSLAEILAFSMEAHRLLEIRTFDPLLYFVLWPGVQPAFPLSSGALVTVGLRVRFS